MRKNIIAALIMSVILPAGAYADGLELVLEEPLLYQEEVYDTSFGGKEPPAEWPNKWPDEWPDEWPDIWYDEPGIQGVLISPDNHYWPEDSESLVTITLTGPNLVQAMTLYYETDLAVLTDIPYADLSKAIALTNLRLTPGDYNLEYAYTQAGANAPLAKGSRTIRINAIQIEGEDEAVEGEDTPVEGEGPIIEGETIPVEGEPVVIEGEEPVIEGETVSVEGEPVVTEGEEPVIEGETIPVEGEPVVMEGEEPTVEGETVPVEGEPVVIEGEEPVIEGETLPVEGEPVVIEGETVDEDDGGCKGCSSGKAATGAPLEKLQKGLADWLLVSLSGLVLVVLSYGRRK